MVAAALRTLSGGAPLAVAEVVELDEVEQELDQRLEMIKPELRARVPTGARRARRNLGEHALLGQGKEAIEEAGRTPQRSQRHGRGKQRKVGECDESASTGSLDSDALLMKLDGIISEMEVRGDRTKLEGIVNPTLVGYKNKALENAESTDRGLERDRDLFDIAWKWAAAVADYQDKLEEAAENRQAAMEATTQAGLADKFMEAVKQKSDEMGEQ
ncbi:unnamed protein product, partial [Prorocentrum cordatum]